VTSVYDHHFLIISDHRPAPAGQLRANRPIGYDQGTPDRDPCPGRHAATFPLVKARAAEDLRVAGVSAGTDDLVRFGGGSNGVSWPGKTPIRILCQDRHVNRLGEDHRFEKWWRGVSSTPHTVPNFGLSDQQQLFGEGIKRAVIEPKKEGRPS